MGYFNTHGYEDGQELSCGRCDKSVRVKLHRPGDVVISTPASMGDRAMICNDCGTILCVSCMTNGGCKCGGNVTLPCPSKGGTA